ncbi:MAG: hypothetical protein ABI638_15525, partial [Ignavibacteriota bacterium]
MKFEIFKTGTHISDKGVTKDYSLDELNFIAQSYKPEEDEAPIVIGHPVDNSPAYGWVSSLEVTEDGKLVADAPDEKLNPEFVSALKEGSYKKRSISLTPEGKLRHVGFLGAAAPAVKGLADIQFSHPSSTVIEFDLNEPLVLNSFQDPLELNSFDSIQSQLNEINEIIKSKRSIDPDLSGKLNNNFSESQNNELSTKFNQLSNEIASLKSKITKSEFESLLDIKLGVGSLTPA